MYLCEIYSFLLGQSCCLYLIFHSGDPRQRTRSYGRWPCAAAATLFSLTGGSTCSHRQASSRWFLHRHRQPWPRATMVPFWGTPRGCPSFLSPRCRHPPQPYTTNAAFRDLWTMQPSPGDLTQTPPLSPRPFLVSTAFFCLGTVRHFAGTPAVALPLRRRVGRSLSRPPSRAPF